jgi:predicted glycogen debranching enzyme
VFMDRDSAPAYNTVDASLWFVDRVFQYMKYTNDQELLFLIWPTLDSIIQHYIQGTDFGIHMDSDGLICHGPGLTWMDVKLGDYYPTPRDQKAVEIQALWYNALRIMGLLAPLVNRRDWFSQYASKVQSSFRQHYDKLYDVLDCRDTSLRPNMVFLASLDFPLADEKLQEEIVDEIQDHLLSLFGLQTLTSTDPRFKGSLLGPYNKDVAYHNGIVWPWLLGPFLTAFVKVHKNDRKMRQLAQESFLNPMFEIFGQEWDGSVPELFDAEPPFAPQGCISQAWSVGEILRAIIEDIEGRRPPFEKLLHEIRV